MALIAHEGRSPTNVICATAADIGLTKVLISGSSPDNNGTMDDRVEAKELAVPEAAATMP